MQLDTPEGKLTITDDSLRFEPVDDGPTIDVALSPMPEYRYESSVYGTGALVIADAYIVLRNEQAPEVITELRRERRPKTAAKPVTDKPAAQS
jgi:hypothetical protein